MLNIVLYEPEIPQNTGNIARTCMAIGARLHLIEPLGFFIDDKQLKRAGMDYWDKVDVNRYINFTDFQNTARPKQLFCVSTKTEINYTAVIYSDHCYLVFGRESAGLPSAIMEANAKIRVPMVGESRSLNLANTVAVVAYEVMRQWSWPGLI